MMLVGQVTRPPIIKANTGTIFPSETEIPNKSRASVNECKQVGATNKSINASLLSRFLSAPNDSWKLSREVGRPWLARDSRWHPLTKFYVSADSSYAAWSRKDLFRAGFGSVSGNVRNYSFRKEPRDDKSKPCDSGEGEKERQEVPKDCCSQPENEKEELCQQPERLCPPPTYPEDPGVCKPIPCPDIRDYCTTPVSYKETLWKLVTLLSLPVIILVSGFVYTREVEKRKRPRPEFIDVPYMRRITKPFPWGDGKHSLFHNPRLNPISPHGYEVEDPNALPETSD